LAGFQQSTFWGFLLQNLAKNSTLKKFVASFPSLKKHAKFCRKQNKIFGNIFVTLQPIFSSLVFKSLETVFYK
jgi:hypothetical protein